VVCNVQHNHILCDGCVSENFTQFNTSFEMHVVRDFLLIFLGGGGVLALF
jgi:hypothetical protein